MNDELLQAHEDLALMAMDETTVHVFWAAKFLQAGRHSLALEAFDRFLSLAHRAEDELKPIRSMVAARDFGGAVAVEWRAERDGKRQKTARVA